MTRLSYVSKNSWMSTFSYISMFRSNRTCGKLIRMHFLCVNPMKTLRSSNKFKENSIFVDQIQRKFHFRWPNAMQTLFPLSKSEKNAIFPCLLEKQRKCHENFMFFALKTFQNAIYSWSPMKQHFFSNKWIRWVFLCNFYVYVWRLSTQSFHCPMFIIA